jgi:hypothetical protein
MSPNGFVHLIVRGTAGHMSVTFTQGQWQRYRGRPDKAAHTGVWVTARNPKLVNLQSFKGSTNNPSPPLQRETLSSYLVRTRSAL